MGWLVFLGVVALVAFGAWVFHVARKARLYDQRKPRIDYLDAAEAELKESQAALETLVSEKTLGFPWLATAWGDFVALKDARRAMYLQYKPHPARKAAQHIREVAAEKRRIEKLWRILRYKLAYYESLFPWLVDFTGEEIDELIAQTLAGEKQKEHEATSDPARHWLTAGEYQRLSSVEKYQLALDRYWTKKKSKWEIGRDYERYVGYLYELKGYRVQYQGIVEGFADLGRDLIATGREEVIIVQCKCWSKHKQIHEKHVFQLYGTLLAYQIDHPRTPARAVLTTSTTLSPRATQFADMLGIRYEERVPFEAYPSVKCNVSRKDGTKIYHLPFDQQYDRTVVEEERGERYVFTVAQAEQLGFRRAFRWRAGRGEQSGSRG